MSVNDDDAAKVAESKEILSAPVLNNESVPQIKEQPEPDNPPLSTKPRSQNRWHNLMDSYWSNKRRVVPLTILTLIILLLALPFTRYSLLGLFLKKDFSIVVLDTTTKKPVTNAAVEVGSTHVLTDSKGQVKVPASVGKIAVKVSKKYYKPTVANTLVPISQKEAYTMMLQATGRQVPLTITNKITGKPLADVVIRAADSEAKTGTNGKVTMVLPAGKSTVQATITAGGYNTLSTTIHVTEKTSSENSFMLVPTGRVYFLSKLSGKIDVVKTNLDGSDRQTVLPGTGNEQQFDTILLASRDWKYLTLKSRRDGGDTDKLFLIDTSSDKLTTMDEGDANFTDVGWSGHRFVYQVNRNGVSAWQPKSQALKTYDAETGKLVTLDETTAEGVSDYSYAHNSFGTTYILNDEIVYNKNWYASYYSRGLLDGKQVSLTSVRADGSARKTIKEFPVNSGTTYSYINLSLYEPQGIYVQVPGSPNSYFEYENGKLEAKSDVTDETYNQGYPTYLVSPSGKQTFWSEPRDGKTVLFVGDTAGANAKQIASLSEYSQYGWYSDDYLLVSKNGSELYIMPVAGGTPLKVSDYHKPNQSFGGYGYGYGGF